MNGRLPAHNGGADLIHKSPTQDLEFKANEIAHRYEQATSEQELQDLIGSIDTITRQVDTNLDDFIAKSQPKCQQDVTTVELNRAKLSDTISVTGDLIKIFSTSNDLGNSLTYQLKSLDKQIEKVNETTEYVSKIKLLKNSINQAVYALEHNNWELAAKCIHAIRSEVPQDIIEGQYASKVIPSSEIPELPQVVINKSIEQLVEVFRTKFDEAASQRNIPQLTTFFQLFPLVGKEETGLVCYSKFICQIITDTSRSLVQSISSSSSGDNPKPMGLYSRSGMQLFENISMMLSQHTPLIKKYYSSTYPNAIPFVITRIQHEIDSQIGLITDTFYDDNRFDKVLQDIKLYKFPILSKRLNPNLNSESGSARQSGEFSRPSFDDTELVTIVQAGDLFTELANILHYWSLYCKFVATRYFNEVIEYTNKLALPALIFDSNYTKKILSKYLPAFENTFTFYFRRSLEKAISIEELPPLDSYLLITNVLKYPEQPPCSSVIEDFTLVLNNCLRNIINSGQESSVKTFSVDGFKIIQQDLINGYILKELHENQPRYNSSLSLINPKMNALSGVGSPRNLRSATPVPENSGGGMGFFKGAQSAFGNVVSGSGITTNSASGSIANNPRLVKFVIYLNTVAVGQEYFSRIIDNFVKNDSYNIRNHFPFSDDADIVTTILTTEMLDPFVTLTNKIINESLINFYNQSIKTRILQILGEFLPDSDDSNYLLYSTSSLNDTALAFSFINQWRTLITPYKQLFHHELVYNKLIRLIVINLANAIERRLIHVLKKFKINELGSLKLEKDISSCISEVCEDNYDLREKFVRVTQLVLLVGMDDEEYEESNSYQQTEIKNDASNPDANDDINDDDYLGIKWVLTPLERRQFRKFRI